MYMGDSGEAHEQVSYATADNILGPYTKYSETTPFIPFGPTGSFDAGTVADPWVVEFHGTYYIGYTVSSSTYSPWQTAYATTTDWLTLTKHGVTLPLASSGWDSNNAFRGAVTRIGDTYVFPYTGDSYQMGIATQPVYMTVPVNDEASVFPFFDEFNGAGIDTTKWAIPSGGGSLSQLTFSGSYMSMTATSAYIKVLGKTSFGMDYLVEGYAMDHLGGTSQKIPEIGLDSGDFASNVRLVADFHTPFNHWEFQAKGSADTWTDMGIVADINWHRLRAYRLSPNTAGFQVGSEPAQTTTNQVPTNALYPFLMSYGSENQFDVDWIRVRKYCGYDAAASVGSVEPRPLNPSISITKTGPSQVLSGSTVTLNITVTNNGDYQLSGVTVVDVLTPDCNRAIGSLAISHSESYTCSASNVTQSFTNSATASGSYGATNVSNTAILFVEVLHPSIAIDKGPSSQVVIHGSTVSFSIAITNTGDVALQNVAVTDALAPDCSHTIGTLTAGQSTSYTCSLANARTNFTNSATVTSQGPLSSNPAASDTAAVTVRTLTEAPWLDPGWSYRRPVLVSCPCGRQVSGFQVKITLDSSFDFAHTQPAGSDLRVTDQDGVTQIPFWIESWSPPQATVWVKLPQLPPSGTFIYFYYGNQNPPGPVVHEMPPIGPWTRAAGNPIIPAGVDGTSLLAEDIVYDSVTTRYWMPLANYSRGAISLVSSANPTNAAAWTWEGNVIFPTHMFSGAPHLVQEGGIWYLFYADWPNIMLATSTNVGGPYTGNTLVLSPSESWETYRVDEPYVLKLDNGTWVLIYMADSGSTTEQVGFATAGSITGPYTKDSHNPVLAFGPSGSYDAGTVADPWVYKYHDTYYIGYTVSPTKSSPWQTAYATTTDWVTFTKHGITLPLAASGWDSVNAFRGAVTRIGDVYVFSYTGDGYQMGVATQPVFMQEPFNEPGVVFPFYDDFNDGSFDTTKWVIESGGSSQLSEMGGTLTLNSTGTTAGQFSKIYGQTSFGMDYVMEAYARHPQAGSAINMISEIGLMGAGFNGDKVRIADDFHNTANWERQAMLSSTPDDPWVTTSIPVTTGWHTFRVSRISPNTAGFMIDNALETTTSNVPTSNLPAFLMSFGSGNQFEVDWIRVRRWCGSEPAIVLEVEQNNPTAVTVSSFTGSSYLSTAQLEWETANEMGLVGFNLYRSQTLDGLKQMLNPDLLPAQYPDQMLGASYQFSEVVEQGQRYYYWLELVRTDGNELMEPVIVATDYLIRLPLMVR
jgi:uncharacterized repeat protein (TIGR01451 family)